jgi:hypothetical protein
MLKEKINYKALKNTKQREIYNFQKASAIFADYGYTTIKLSDDWMGADFIAISFDGTEYLKVQLKGRLTFAKKYQGKDKNIHICFRDDKSGIWYLYNHDELLKKFTHHIENSDSWENKGEYHFPLLNKEKQALLVPFAIGK